MIYASDNATGTGNSGAMVHNRESSQSAIFWTAIFGGAFVAVGVTIILLTLGSGLGFASISPWKNDGVTTSTLSMMAVIWLFVVQWLATAAGGFLTGRLRTKWVDVHTSEVGFRDTVHGLIVWAVSTVFMIMLFGHAASAVIGGATDAAGKVASGASMGAAAGAAANADELGSMDVNGYYIDSLFRNNADTTSEDDTSEYGDDNTTRDADDASERPTAAQSRSEAGRIFLMAAKDGKISEKDEAYLAQLIAERTNLSEEEANARVDEVMADMKEARKDLKKAADEARETAARLSFFTAMALLLGAFIGCVSGALGGRIRDDFDTIYDRDAVHTKHV